MVEIRVELADASAAHGLMRRLEELFGGTAVSFDVGRREVHVRSEWESRAIERVLEAVESWLATEGVDSAELWVGGRSTTLAGAGVIAA